MLAVKPLNDINIVLKSMHISLSKKETRALRVLLDQIPRLIESKVLWTMVRSCFDYPCQARVFLNKMYELRVLDFEIKPIGEGSKSTIGDLRFNSDFRIDDFYTEEVI